jgi:nitroimidazol reductase NimA-like FMN-containing flavoprotein (pyridoxamine 5'-phosphate oxidase superfamily)
MHGMSAARRLHQLSRSESLALLGEARLGRVGVSVDALPVILPVFIVVVRDRIVFRTAPGTKLTAAVNGAIVALEADQLDEATGEGWSVLVRGVAREVVDSELAGLARPHLATAWLDGTHEYLVEVTTDLVTGRRLGPDGSAPR